MKPHWILGSVAVVACSVAFGACGSAHKEDRSAAGRGGTTNGGPQTSAATVSAPNVGSGSKAASLVPTADDDGDSRETTTFDADDHYALQIGRAASASDRRDIAALVERYYQAISTGDGTTACSLLFRIFAETLPETTNPPNDHREESCAEIVSQVVAPLHRRLVAEAKSLKVIGVRVKGLRAWAIMRFGPKSVRRIEIFREGARWKVSTVIDKPLV